MLVLPMDQVHLAVVGYGLHQAGFDREHPGRGQILHLALGRMGLSVQISNSAVGSGGHLVAIVGMVIGVHNHGQIGTTSSMKFEEGS